MYHVYSIYGSRLGTYASLEDAISAVEELCSVYDPVLGRSDAEEFFISTSERYAHRQRFL